MKTNETTREKISALADGELSDQQVDMALAALRQPETQADWELYHQIGDVLRSEDMAITMSSGFAARMAARLEAEPTIMAPAAFSAGSSQPEERQGKRWAVPSLIAAAAMATVAFITTPQLMVAMKGESSPHTAINVASSPDVSDPSGVVAASAPEGVVMRDSRIDDYLLAHQRFSPSLYSSTQYARSAAFSSDSGK